MAGAQFATTLMNKFIGATGKKESVGEKKESVGKGSSSTFSKQMGKLKTSLMACSCLPRTKKNTEVPKPVTVTKTESSSKEISNDNQLPTFFYTEALLTTPLVLPLREA